MTIPGWVLAVVLASAALGGPAAAQVVPAPSPPVSSTRAPGDAFGQDITLTEKTIIYFSGSGTWDQAFETIVDAFKTVYAYLDKQGVKRAGPPMTIYTSTDDTSFQFQAAVPIAEPLKDPPKGDIAMGQSPTGRALKFVHRGTYDAMDATYEAITSYLDEKQLDAKDLFIEEYVTDPVSTPEDKLVIEVLVPVK